MPKTPKVPRPPVVDAENSGLTANEMQSLMHSDDKASGFSTKGHIDLRKLDADPSSDAVTARPRAPSLPTDAKEYEPEVEKGSRRGVLLGAIGLATVGAVAAYLFMGTSGGSAETGPQSETEHEVSAAPTAEEAIETPSSVEPPEVSDKGAEVAVAQPEDKSEQKAASEAASRGSKQRASARVEETERSVKSGLGPQPAESEELESLDTDDIARRAAAVQGEESTKGIKSVTSDGAKDESLGGAVDDALTEKTKTPKSLDELLDTATGDSNEFEGEKPAPPPPSGDAPSKADVSKVMGKLMPGFRSCAGAQVGLATALVAVKSSGEVVSARVSGTPFGGTRQGECMEDVIKRRAQFDPFKKTRFEFRYPIRINP